MSTTTADTTTTTPIPTTTATAAINNNFNTNPNNNCNCSNVNYNCRHNHCNTNPNNNCICSNVNYNCRHNNYNTNPNNNCSNVNYNCSNNNSNTNPNNNCICSNCNTINERKFGGIFDRCRVKQFSKSSCKCNDNCSTCNYCPNNCSTCNCCPNKCCTCCDNKDSGFQLQPRYQSEFPSSFTSLEVFEFRNGSIFNFLKLFFQGTSIPNDIAIAQVLLNAAPEVNGFDIEGTSITVDGIDCIDAMGTRKIISVFLILIGYKPSQYNCSNNNYSTNPNINYNCRDNNYNTNPNNNCNCSNVNYSCRNNNYNTNPNNNCNCSNVNYSNNNYNTNPNNNYNCRDNNFNTNPNNNLGLSDETFSEELKDRSSGRFKNLEQKLVGPCNTINERKFGVIFDRCRVKQFRRNAATRAEGTTAEMEVLFHNNVTTSELPQNEVVAETFKLAANNNTFNVTIDSASIQVIDSPVAESTATTPTTTATTPTTTATTPITTATTPTTTATTPTTTATTPTTTATTPTTPITVTPTYTVSVGLPDETFSEELKNRSSGQFKKLEQKLVGPCNTINERKFGVIFDRCRVKQFRRNAATRAEGTTAEMEVLFHNNVTTSELPQNELVAETFKLAANNNTFNVTIDSASIQVIASPVANATTTAPPATAAPTTAPPATAPPVVTTKTVVFRSRLDTFTSDLLDSSTDAFKSRALNIKSQLQPRYQSEFPSSFTSLEVFEFRNGSIFNFLKLFFRGTSIPNDIAIAQVLLNAASEVNGFDIEGTSITVDGIASSGVSQKISLVTASCLVLLSWLLSSQQ
ncbi:putative mediator of RNA polymerase II transcription subunit 24 [Paralichthys olivaceus]|uniref:putative mediator of RNA polymerase II transcription subunit 24 n=1 Tax=Paralichthys olivaceus TaxID=8255 RepID=UPI0037535976